MNIWLHYIFDFTKTHWVSLSALVISIFSLLYSVRNSKFNKTLIASEKRAYLLLTITKLFIGIEDIRILEQKQKKLLENFTNAPEEVVIIGTSENKERYEKMYACVTEIQSERINPIRCQEWASELDALVQMFEKVKDDLKRSIKKLEEYSENNKDKENKKR